MEAEKQGEELLDEEQPQEEVDESTDESTTDAEANEGDTSENIDYHVPESPKPERSEKEKAAFTLKSVIKRYRELGGDPNEFVGTPQPTDVDTSQFVTKKDFLRSEAEKIATSPKEVEAIMAWVDKGLSLDEAHLLANKNKIKATFEEVERGNVQHQKAVGAGEKRPAPRAPEPSLELVREMRMSGLQYDAGKKKFVGKKTEVVWNGTEWASQRI